jgi:hypothetical protein
MPMPISVSRNVVEKEPQSIFMDQRRLLITSPGSTIDKTTRRTRRTSHPQRLVLPSSDDEILPGGIGLSSCCYYLYERQVVFLLLLTLNPASAQTTKRYCDPVTSICYSGWTGTNGITFGIALPEIKNAPFDTALQIVSPRKNGWVGFSWGGTMPYVPLTVGWVNDASNTTIYSSRMAL